MICFDVLLNGRTVCRAGIEGYGVVTAMTHVAHRISTASGKPADEEEIEFSVAGLVHDDTDDAHIHLDWVQKTLLVGDEITVRVVDADSPDEATRTREEVGFRERQEYKYYLRLKEKYEADAGHPGE